MPNTGRGQYGPDTAWEPPNYIGRPDPSWKTPPEEPRGWHPETRFETELGAAVGLFGVERRIPVEKAYEAAADYLDRSDPAGFPLAAAGQNGTLVAIDWLQELVGTAATGRGTPMNEAAAYTAARIRRAGPQYAGAIGAATAKLFPVQDRELRTNRNGTGKSTENRVI